MSGGREVSFVVSIHSSSSFLDFRYMVHGYLAHGGYSYKIELHSRALNLGNTVKE